MQCQPDIKPGMNGTCLREGFVDFEGWKASGSDWYAAEVHAGAAGELGVLRVRWVCFPLLLPETQGGAR